VETGKGQIVVVTTSSGPAHPFKTDLWDNDRTKYEAVFYSWKERPGRDDEWYAQESKEHFGDPLYMKREYPNTVEEAFEAHEGRIYPFFTTTGKYDASRYKEGRSVKFLPMEDENGARIWPQLYRAIDWGMRDAFVCLFIAHNPLKAPALTVDPYCLNTIREMLTYSYKEGTDLPMDIHNHAPDAIRYAVVQWRLKGHVHIYAEIYIDKAAAKGWSTPKLAMLVREKSEDDKFIDTVADRAGVSDISTFGEFGVHCSPALKLGIVKAFKLTDGQTNKEVLAGCRLVNNLIVGGDDISREERNNPVQMWIRRIKDGSAKNTEPISRDDRVWRDQARLKTGTLAKAKGSGYKSGVRRVTSRRISKWQRSRKRSMRG
jgi:hypothetical protein